MRRFLWLIVLSLGIAQQASAQQAPALPASAPEAAASAPSVASAPLADANDQPNEANRRITSYLTKKFGVAKERAAKLADIVSVTATKYSLPPALVYAIISIESRFQEKARGQHGATGLMQVVPTAHRGLVRNVKDLTDPNANVEVGSAILSGYVRAAGGDVRAGLRSYSGGSNAYAAKVMQRVDSFRFVLEPDDDAKAVNPANSANDAKARMVPVSEKTSPASARGN
ncbi:MAG: lytic transglycosylase domain-containing protein [Burkholderia contaminans]|uniref:Lytic transglycosylase domain-containing protein n=1 Tax=Burkholderia contaminans TaxID=488447 RepID=A0AAP4R8U7_9BURK|nr:MULTISPECIES: lytic transglycosylase domain-containing protein [Burkholderia]MBD1414481.1 lytic transglycosylase domain-containing protein [Burkholderia contaminans]MBH9672470.1 lytic transglycosylase domain-containing protein [Burkholderia contaminans]MBH9679832.1 lytic transglycosylase domain-containing protein [Burkholderia contaminans]MBH9709879.1 lytic transglycosylase domain-containing protein [Burkholderia contaminans]MBH9724601.1 lytic transglycosylase domain-containing protein [Bur